VRAAARLAAAALVAGAAARDARAQGALRGQLSLVERAGARGADLGDAVLFLAPADDDARDGGRDAGLAWLDGAAIADTASISMHRREFEPHVRVVRAGGRVGFPNDDPFSHNVFSNSMLGPFDLGLYRAGASRAARFPRAGAYAIYCNIHHRMVSYVVAVPTPLAVRAGADGRFAIAGVPAGRWVLHAWHERAGESVRTIVVPPAGLDVRVELDARAYVPAAHLNKFGLPYAATRADRY